MRSKIPKRTDRSTKFIKILLMRFIVLLGFPRGILNFWYAKTQSYIQTADPIRHHRLGKKTNGQVLCSAEMRYYTQCLTNSTAVGLSVVRLKNGESTEWPNL